MAVAELPPANADGVRRWLRLVSIRALQIFVDTDYHLQFKKVTASTITRAMKGGGCDTPP